jgi:hypothetical protein
MDTRILDNIQPVQVNGILKDYPVPDLQCGDKIVQYGLSKMKYTDAYMLRNTLLFIGENRAWGLLLNRSDEAITVKRKLEFIKQPNVKSDFVQYIQNVIVNFGDEFGTEQIICGGFNRRWKNVELIKIMEGVYLYGLSIRNEHISENELWLSEHDKMNRLRLVYPGRPLRPKIVLFSSGKTGLLVQTLTRNAVERFISYRDFSDGMCYFCQCTDNGLKVIKEYKGLIYWGEQANKFVTQDLPEPMIQVALKE